MTGAGRHSARAAAAASASAPLLFSLLASLFTPMTVGAVEEPGFRVVRTLGNEVEVRDYARYVVAEVTVPGPADDAGRQAFPILAGYIFGKNHGETKMAMTVPVTQAPAQGPGVSMTAAVTNGTATPAGSGFVVQFVLPAAVDLAAAPRPLDPRIRLREVAPMRLAAIRYSGLWTQANQNEYSARLQATLQAAGLAWTGEPVLARYNGPMTPGFLRRNEIWLALR